MDLFVRVSVRHLHQQQVSVEPPTSGRNVNAGRVCRVTLSMRGIELDQPHTLEEVEEIDRRTDGPRPMTMQTDASIRFH